MHPLTLTFTDTATEQAYHQHDMPRLIFQGRLATVIAIVAYVTLGFAWDRWLFASEIIPLAWNIRLTALLAPLAVLALTFHPLYRRINSLPLAMTGLAGGWSLILISLYLPPQMLADFYPGLILVTFFTYNFAGTRFVYALAVDLSILFAYNLAALWRGDIPLTSLALHDFIMFFSNLIGGAAGYVTELQRRQLFISEMNLHNQIKEVEKSKQEAETANTAKSHFLAAASHDLRQPIHALGLFLGAMDRGNLNSLQQEILANADKSIHTCQEMLESLLNFSRIEANVIQATPENFALQPLLHKLHAEFCTAMTDTKLDLRLHDTSAWVRADPLLAELILRNLLANALRYTDKGGVLVGVRVHHSTQEAIVEVWDTGIGIAPEHQQVIFREFHQLGNPERDHRKGLGLGLAISEGLCQHLGGRISLRSHPGRGSVFRLHLPLGEKAVPPEATGT